MTSDERKYHPFQSADPPPTNLGIYRVLSPRASLRVSPFCFGGATVGDKWSGYVPSVSKEDSLKLLDSFYEMGGNFIDTACNYQFEESEKIIGEWLETRGVRDQITVATKFTGVYKQADPSVKQKIAYFGNNFKNMTVSLENSLKKLRTSYVDIYYVHFWDWDTSIKEVMDGLHNLVVSGKVLYLGISDTPAWVVAQANQYADCMGKTPFSIYQGKWSILDRSFERDIIPMARLNGMALAPFGVVGGGRLRTDEEEKQREKANEKGRSVFGEDWKRTEPEKKLCLALEKVAGEVGTKNIRAVAIAYVMQKTPYVFPIIGTRSVESLKENLEALNISLTPEQVKYIESEGPPFDLGFPYDMIGDSTSMNWLFDMAGKIQRVPFQQAIRPSGSQ
ncbi:Aldo/keto reductase [Dendrothele bispora CBS 962.96]|uniref:Aldo/keto reductase n=1 Tax=Dendrothele bispora (strain CBS 962.96) TaxID=1314807 RepID=A0A4S8M598_DENBC|nr:Aldo/keto reductase [Dendrothele bispora CBS 962.96]